jgi:mycothiol synthase
VSSEASIDALPTIPQGYSVRGVSEDDAGRVGGLLLACDLADWGSPDYTEEMLRHDWRLPGLDLANDAWIITDPSGSIAAYTWVYARNDHAELVGWGLVHPGHRGRGLGTYLVVLREHRGKEHAALAPPGKPVVLRNDVIAPDRAVHQILESRGYREVRHFWQMRIDLPQTFAPPASPEGIRVRTFLPGQDDRAVHRTIEDSFAEHWGWVPRSFEEWAARALDPDLFDPELWFLAEDDGELAGAALGAVVNREGWVATLGVRKAWRRRGIGECLLRTSFAAFHQRDLRTVTLEVDSENETGASALYERVGMRVHRQYDNYEKQIR